MTVANFKSRFNSLFFELTQVMVRKKVDCAYVIQTLHGCPTEQIGEHFKFLLNMMAESIETFRHIEQLNQYLKQYLWFCDYKIVREMISKFANDRSAGLMEKVYAYESEIEEFSQTTSIAVLSRSGYHEDDKEVPEHYTEMQVKHELDPERCTLKDLEDFQKRLGQKLCASMRQDYATCAMIFFKLEVDLGEVTWLIPEILVPNLMAATIEQKNRKFFKEQKILSISIAGKPYFKHDANSGSDTSEDIGSEVGEQSPPMLESNAVSESKEKDDVAT